LIKVFPTSFTKCEVDGSPAVIAFDGKESQIIDIRSPFYLHAVTAMVVLEKCSEKKAEIISFPKLVVNNVT